MIRIVAKRVGMAIICLSFLVLAFLALVGVVLVVFAAWQVSWVVGVVSTLSVLLFVGVALSEWGDHNF